MWKNFKLNFKFDLIVTRTHSGWSQCKCKIEPQHKHTVKSIMSAVWMQNAKGIYWIDVTVDWTNDPLFLCKYYCKILVWTRNMWIAEPCEVGEGGMVGERKLLV